MQMQTATPGYNYSSIQHPKSAQQTVPIAIEIRNQNRGFILHISTLDGVTDTLFLAKEKLLARDILFATIDSTLKIPASVVDLKTDYVCPKCEEGVLALIKDDNNSWWECTKCRYKIAHYVK